MVMSITFLELHMTVKLDAKFEIVHFLFKSKRSKSEFSIYNEFNRKRFNLCTYLKIILIKVSKKRLPSSGQILSHILYSEAVYTRHWQLQSNVCCFHIVL